MVPGPEHFLFIPAVLLVGVVLGYTLGARITRAEIDKKRQRAKE